MRTFEIDFCEFMFLVEACIPPRPIARMHFWHKVIDIYYQKLTPEQRKKAFEWINRNWVMEDGLKKKNKDCLMFNARFNPANQYIAFTEYNGRKKKVHCFKCYGKYYINRNTHIDEKFIKTVEHNPKNL